MNAQTFDVIVVGSGAAGSFAAKELTEQGLRVLVLEAGPAMGKQEFSVLEKLTRRVSDINFWARAKAAAGGQSVQSKAIFFDERLKSLFVNDRHNPYTTPRDAPYLWFRGKQAGGRLHTFGRTLLRWSDDDFKGKSRTGNGVDWPISHDDLAPYYGEVERFLDMHGRREGVGTLPDSECEHEAELTEAEEIFRDEVERHHPLQRVISWRYMLPDRERVPAPLRAAIATGRLTIRYHASAREVLCDPVTGKASGVAIVDTDTGGSEVFTSRAVVVCASPIESVRLMLNSKSPRHPGGLGNSTGMLGRFFMDQLPCVAAGTFPRTQGFTVLPAAARLNPDPLYRHPGGIFIPRRAKSDGDQAARNFGFQGKIGRDPVPDGTSSRFAFVGYGQMEASADNHITLDPVKRDKWGLPVPHIRCAMSTADRALLSAQERMLETLVTAAGGKFDYIGSPLGLREIGRGALPHANPITRFMFRTFFLRTMRMGSAIHESGGARMGKDPSTSVVDEWGRVWDAANVRITDASCFPSSGVAGTTLTVMAQTVRACRKLAMELGAGHR